MDILSLISDAQRYVFAQNYNYERNYIGEKLFTPEKTADLKARIRYISEGGQLPVMAQAHAFDTEARIGERPDFSEIELNKMFIKEKIDQNERVIEFLGNNASRDAVIEFLYNDYAMMADRCITRAEVARMELLATGKVSYKENEVNSVVDYHVPTKNIFNGATDTAFKDWDVAGADIIGAIEKVVLAAKKKGYKVVRAITSSTIIGYMLKNTAIINLFYKAPTAPILTETSLKAWLLAMFGIEFVVVDDMYKVEAKATSAYRFFPEMSISFLTTVGTVGASLYGYTPEELRLASKGGVELSNKNYVTITSWEDPSLDPIRTWTKASSLFVPALKDPNGLYIAQITT